MALAQGDIVAVHRESVVYADGYQGQPPMFGIVSEGPAAPGAPVAILWEDGKHEAAVQPDFVLDKIVGPAAASVVGHFVHVNPATGGYASAEFTGPVVESYRRQLNGAGAVSDDLALVRCTTTGLYLEYLTSAMNIAAGR